MIYFVTAIGTDSGKTLTSAILCQFLGADYWKPVQAGLPRDIETVKRLVTNTEVHFHPENYLLNTAASPHASARIDGIDIATSDLKLPVTTHDLIIEGAGGVLVPLNDREYVIDMVEHFKAQIIVVANLYLGSINHTLLTVEAIKSRNLSVKGLIFNGPSTPESERIILEKSGWKCLLNINQEPIITPETVKKYAHKLRESWV